MLYLAYLIVNGEERVFNVYTDRADANRAILSGMYQFLPGFNLTEPQWRSTLEATEDVLKEYNDVVKNHPLKFLFKVKEIKFNLRDY